MIRIFLLPVFLCVSMFALAQEDDRDLISRFRPGSMWFFTGARPAEVGKVRKYDRFIIDTYYNDWYGPNASTFDKHWTSIGFRVSMMADRVWNKNNTVGWAYGLAFQRDRIRFDDFLVRNSANNSSILVADNNSLMQKSWFYAAAIAVPIEFRFRTPGWKHAKVHLGISPFFRLGAKTRYHYDSPASLEEIIEQRGFFDLQRLSASAYARVGIRNWALFASSDLRSYFTSAASSDLRALQFGISLSFF